MQGTEFTSGRSSDVRKQARAKLQLLRQERLNKRARWARIPSKTNDEPELDELIAPTIEAELMSDDVTSGAAGDVEQKNHVGETNEELAPEPEPQNDACEDPAAATSETCETVEQPDSAQSEDLTEPTNTHAASDIHDETKIAEDLSESEKLVEEVETGSHTEQTESILAHESQPLETDLKELTGAGPGLIWMLMNCSIHSLKDLSEAEPEALKADLGVVGKILDVEALIEHAKELSQTSAHAG